MQPRQFLDVKLIRRLLLFLRQIFFAPGWTLFELRVLSWL